MISINFESILQNSDPSNNHSLDDPRRVQLNQSIWQKLFHLKEKNELDKKIKDNVESFFYNRYHFKDKDAFKRIWEQLGAKIWSGQDTLTIKILFLIEANFKNNLIYHGDGIHPCKPSEEVHSSPKKVDSTVQKVVQALLHGGNFSPLSIEKKAAKAIFVTHDKQMMEEFREKLQAEMDNLAEHPPKNKHEEVVWRAFLGNVVSLLPFSYPEKNTLFTIPVLKGNDCRKVSYQTEIIPLKYNSFSTPMPCLALTPTTDPSTPPILSFIGTTFPTGPGFAATLLTDSTPGYSVGEIVHKRNISDINDWLKNKQNVHVFGMSLGGAMAFHTIRHHPQISRADVYNPPGLYAKNWKKTIDEKCQVNIYCQPGDLVSQMGLWPTGDNISLYTVYSHQENVSEGLLSSHARAFTGCDRVSIVKEDPAKENKSIKRYLLTKLHQIFGPFAIYLPVCCTLLLYRLAHATHRASKYCFKKIRETFKSK